jgi:hypothetical protein
MVILILDRIVVVVIGTIVLVAVPVRHVEAVARDLPWRRSVDIGTRVWVRHRYTRVGKERIEAAAEATVISPPTRRLATVCLCTERCP